MKAGISTACLYPQDTLISLQEIGQGKIQCAELFVNTWTEFTKEYFQKVKEEAQRADVEIVSVHPFTSGFEPTMFFTDYEGRFTDSLELYKQFFDLSAQLGAKIFVFHGDRKGSPFSDDGYFERFSRLQETAKQYGLIFAQENVERCRSGKAEFIRKMYKALPQARFVFDLKQALRAGEDQQEMLHAMGDRVCHIHISDHSSGQECLPIGKGILDVQNLLGELRGFSYDGAIILELYRENFSGVEDLWESYERIRQIL